MTRRLPTTLHGDLLRALALAGDDPAVAERLARRLGFVAKAGVPDRPGPGTSERPVQAEEQVTVRHEPAPVSPATDRLQAALIAVTHIERRSVAETLDLPPSGTPLEVADCLPRRPGPAPTPAPLMAHAARWPVLRQTVSNTTASGLDVPALVRQMALGESFRRLPKRQLRSTAGQLWVLQDVCDRLMPYQADFDQVVDDLLRLRGEEGLTLWTCRNLPEHTLERVNAQGHVDWCGALPRPPVAMRLLVLSDLGALAPGSALERGWQRWVEGWLRSGVEVVAWVPMAPPQVPRRLAERVRIHGLSGRAGLRPQRGAWATAAQRGAEHARLQGLTRQLQVLASCAVQAAPALVRDLRLLHADLTHEPALEALYWQSADVEHSRLGRVLRPAAAAARRVQLKQLPDAMQCAVLHTLVRHHAHEGQSTEATEVLLWQAHASAGALATAEGKQRIARAEAWWARWAHRAQRRDDWSSQMRSFARDVLSRQGLDERWQMQCAREAAVLAACAGDDIPAPRHVPPHLLLQARSALGIDPSPGQWRLIQWRDAVWAWPADRGLPPRASVLWHEPLRGRTVLLAAASGGLEAHRLPDDGAALFAAKRNLATAAPASSVTQLVFDDARLTLAFLRRPSWADEWGRDARGLFAVAPTPWGRPVQLEPAGVYGSPNELAMSPLSWVQRPVLGQHGASGSRRSVRIAVVHAHADADWHAEVIGALRAGLSDWQVDFWHDQFMTAGARWIDEAAAVRFDAHLVLVLVSPALLSSKTIHELELPALLEGSRRRQFVLMPVLVQADLNLRGSGLERFQTWPYLAPEFVGLSPTAQARERAAEALVFAVREQAELAMKRRAAYGWPASESSALQPTCQVELRVDERYGLYADLAIGTVVQRFRYLPPGEFWMGSTDEERAKLRDDDYERWSRNESPRHRVRLTEGFWLADTACTQALWLAVMGGQNPSRFNDDPNKPVERVSWDDVQVFLARLQALLPPGCRAALPTEAEWEYACRAGTETAFSFGDTVTTDQMNFDGNSPYGGGPKGEYRERTVPVKSLSANVWGLYEMHGNVWEWCADGAFRDYGKVKRGEVVENPFQPPEQRPEALRVVRGGSWILDARYARSALRYAEQRGERYDYLGFRLALKSRSTSSGSGPEPPAPPAAQPPGTGKTVKQASPQPAEPPLPKKKR